MSLNESSTSKRPLETDSSAPNASVKKETVVEAKVSPSTKEKTEEQPAKKPKLLKKEADKPTAEGKDAPPDAVAPKEESPKEAPTDDLKETPEETPKAAETKEEGKKETAPVVPPVPGDIVAATSLVASSISNDEGNCAVSETDAQGRIRKPSNDDILLGRGKPFQNHPGNQRMLKIVDEHKERYLSEKRDKKRAIVEEVLDIIQKNGARFLKRIDHGEYWREVESTVSFEKVSHALRSKVRRPEGFEINPNNGASAAKGPLPILPEGSRQGGAPQMASLYNQQLLQQRGMFPDAAAMGLMANGLMPPFGLMPNMFNPNLMRLPNGMPPTAPNGGGAPNQGQDLEQLVRSQMVDSLLRQRQQLDDALNDVAGGMRLPTNYK
ncbi:MAG: hypothetical protein SGBAC_008788 [Bacillariaceae sp.]